MKEYFLLTEHALRYDYNLKLNATVTVTPHDPPAARWLALANYVVGDLGDFKWFHAHACLIQLIIASTGSVGKSRVYKFEFYTRLKHCLKLVSNLHVWAFETPGV